jgi:hypothetical protein
LFIYWSVGTLVLSLAPYHLAAETFTSCMERQIDEFLTEGMSARKAIERIVASSASKSTPAEPTVNADQLPYQDTWEGLRVPQGKSKALPLADDSRPERVLYFRPKNGEANDFAVAHAIVGNRVVRRETLEVFRNPETGKYELRADIELIDRSGGVRKGPKEELQTCAFCHSVSPEGLHLIHGLPTSVKFPDLEHIPEAGQPGRELLPRWLDH